MLHCNGVNAFQRVRQYRHSTSVIEILEILHVLTKSTCILHYTSIEELSNVKAETSLAINKKMKQNKLYMAMLLFIINA